MGCTSSTDSKPSQSPGTIDFTKPTFRFDDASLTLLPKKEERQTSFAAKERRANRVVFEETATATAKGKTEAGDRREPKETIEKECANDTAAAHAHDLAGHAESKTHGTTANNTGLSRPLRKQRTLVADKDNMDAMVVEYSCHDSSVNSALGEQTKETKWKVQVGYDARPLNISMQVDESVANGAAVQITCNGAMIFKTLGGYSNEPDFEDFEHRWSFRGTIRAINEYGIFELRPNSEVDKWYPGLVTRQREDGLFDAVAMMPGDSVDPQPLNLSGVKREDVREVGTRKQIPERCLTLQVPRDDPQHACLKVDKDLVTHYFAWPSPSPSSSSNAQTQKLELCVSQDCRVVTANVGRAVLSHFASGEVQAVRSEAKDRHHSWTVQVGPFAEHTIALEKKHEFSKVLSLSVDGHPFIEAMAQDIDWHGAGWECKFRFVGERVVHIDGEGLEIKDRMLQRRKYVHECTVSLGDDLDLSSAKLRLDSLDFEELPARPKPVAEEKLSTSPEELRRTYGILVARSLAEEAEGGISRLSSSGKGSGKTQRRFEKTCC